MENGSEPNRFWRFGIGYFVERPVLIILLVLFVVGAGIVVQPFDIESDLLPRDRVAVDAIPDIGENQQIVFTRWPGRSPRDVEDQITYPLTSSLLGMPGVKTIRSSSMLGFSSIYVIFDEDVEFYWSRSRLLEKLASLPSGTLPEGVTATLGPDATALGQVYWYTLEGRDTEGKPAPGWDLHELRSIQDWTVRPALQGSEGVAEVASVGGHVLEYQVDVEPETLDGYDITLMQVANAVREANLDVGARTLEINQIEYVLRGVGQIGSLEDLREVVVTERDGRPIRLSEVAHVTTGPAQRRGVLDVEGAEAVGGVVVARYGANPAEVIEGVKAKIGKIAQGLPERKLADGRVSKVTIVPFYDRSKVIGETLGTLSEALTQQLLITIIVVLLLLGRLRSSAVISSVLPLAVLGSFVAMKLTGVTANVMSLAGIAIAIGTMVDMGIVFTENIVARLDDRGDTPRTQAIIEAAAEVAPAVATSALTTIVSFLPVFGLTASEGKLFGPLAFAKTYALAASLLFSAIVLPGLAAFLLNRSDLSGDWTPRIIRDAILAGLGIAVVIFGSWWIGLIVIVLAGTRFARELLPEDWATRYLPWTENTVVAVIVFYLLSDAWRPLGFGTGLGWNILVVVAVCLFLLLTFRGFITVYPRLLHVVLENKLQFLILPVLLVVTGLTVWRGFDSTFGWLPDSVKRTSAVTKVAKEFPGLSREFMPAFDEGEFLYMPTTMPHASLGAAKEQLAHMDAAIAAVPEVETVVGKLGRVDSALDPAPVSMFETIVSYKPEWGVDEDGNRVRQWRDEIKSTDDIWNAIVEAARQPGLTSAPKLMPIETRIVMLQSGMRAPMGVKVQGPDLETVAEFGRALEPILATTPGVRAETVFAERVVGKPYIEIALNRDAIARYGLSIEDVQRTIQVALGGVPLTRTVEGRERYDVRVRYMREERHTPEALERVLVPAPGGLEVPLGQLATLEYRRGPQMIKSEDTFLTSYVIFDRSADEADTDVVERVRKRIEESIKAGELVVPDGVSYQFAGSYENQKRSEERLRLLVPLTLALIYLLLYLQFRKTSTALAIFAGVTVAMSGGFILIWCYNQAGFLDFGLFGWNVRELLNIGQMNLSVAVWVGFIALLGIATDDGVVMATYLQQRFDAVTPTSIEEIRELVLDAGVRRVRPCMMTTATTLLALLPVLTSTGRGSDVMIPMAVPVVGGMMFELITLFVVPVLWSAREEFRFRFASRDSAS